MTAHRLRGHLALFVVLAVVIGTEGGSPAGSGDGDLGGALSRDDFPTGFAFGAGTSAYQWEGAAAEDGRTPSVWDTFAHAGHFPGNGDVAADGYHKYKMAEEKSIRKDCCTTMISSMNSLRIEPHATLFQYDLPQVLEDEYNGWLSPQIIADFTAYADVCFKEFGDRVTNWTTMNEPNALAILGYDGGIGPPGRCSEPFGNCSKGNSVYEPYVVAHHTLLAHSSAVSLYRRKYQEKQQGLIGINIFIYEFLPFTNTTEDITATERAQAFYLRWFLDPLYYGDYPIIMKKIVGSKLPKLSRVHSEQLIGAFDFIGVNYYTTIYVKDDPQTAPSNKRDFIVDTSVKLLSMTNSATQYYMPGYGLQGVLEYFKQSYGNPPIYIHENGYPMSQDVAFDDGPRVVFLSGNLKSLLDSVRNGSNTKGYFVWSLMDLYELLGGSSPTYGLYYVDFTDKELKRYPRRSAIFYAEFLKGRRDATKSPDRSSDSSTSVSSL